MTIDPPNRITNWHNSKPVISGSIGAQCSFERCSGVVRETPSGFYCQKHYLGLDNCSTDGCIEPAIMDGLCRECAMPSRLSQQEHDDITTKGESPMAACQEQETLKKSEFGTLYEDTKKAVRKLGLQRKLVHWPT